MNDLKWEVHWTAYTNREQVSGFTQNNPSLSNYKKHGFCKMFIYYNFGWERGSQPRRAYWMRTFVYLFILKTLNSGLFVRSSSFANNILDLNLSTCTALCSLWWFMSQPKTITHLIILSFFLFCSTSVVSSNMCINL